jgi:broad-specificity NMP kinase
MADASSQLQQPACLFVTGVSGVGKTTTLGVLRAAGLPTAYSLHDMDEKGVPQGAGSLWRKEQVSAWLGVAVTLHSEHRALVVAGVVEPEDVTDARCPDVAVRYCFLDVEQSVLEARLLGRLGSGAGASELMRVTGQTPAQFIEAVADYAATLRQVFAASAEAHTIDTTSMRATEVAGAVQRWLSDSLHSIGGQSEGVSSPAKKRAWEPTSRRTL